MKTINSNQADHAYIQENWIAAMSLDEDTGLDPPGYKVRAADGIDAAWVSMSRVWDFTEIVFIIAQVSYRGTGFGTFVEAYAFEEILTDYMI